VTAQGTLKTCLYDDGVLDLKHWMRAGLSDEALKDKLLHAFGHRAKDGFEAEANRKDHQPAYESMSTIGG
jgi:cyclic pyranopterin phosphate synthase